MAIKYAGHWSPDTCGCVISIEGDDVCPREFRVHRIRSIQHYEVRSVEHKGNSADDLDTDQIPDGFESYEYVYTTLERVLVDGPCNADHPVQKVGDIHDGGVFHKHHVVSKLGHDHWKGTIEAANPHWTDLGVIQLGITVGLMIKRALGLRPSHQLHDDKIWFQYDTTKHILKVGNDDLELGHLFPRKALQEAVDSQIGLSKVLFL